MKRFLALASVVLALSSASTADAAIITFSFDNQDGAVPGTVSGTITLPDGDGTFAATSVIVTSAPAATSYAVGFDFTSFSTPQNQFTVVGGAIDAGNSHFAGFFNGSTALSINSTLAGGASFLDVLNGANLGATGVRDADSSTLSFSSAAVSAPVPEPATLAVFAGLAAGAFGVRRRKAKTAA